jgi:hypothetical protein
MNSDDVQVGRTKQDLGAWMRDPRSIALFVMAIEIFIGIAVREHRHLSQVIVPDVLAVIVLSACMAWIRPSWTDSPTRTARAQAVGLVGLGAVLIVISAALSFA